MLNKDYILGTDYLPFNVHIGHTWHEVGIILDIIHTYNIRTFIEIGVHIGGLASILIAQQLYDSSFHYIGIEKDERIIDERLRNLVLVPNRFIFGDCFSQHITEIIRNIAQIDGKTIIYCDNGNKPEEILHYCGIPKSGDILMTHDFWDGIRRPLYIEDYGTSLYKGSQPEVLLKDVEFLDKSLDFVRLPEEYLNKTRIIGWTKK